MAKGQGRWDRPVAWSVMSAGWCERSGNTTMSPLAPEEIHAPLWWLTPSEISTGADRSSLCHCLRELNMFTRTQPAHTKINLFKKLRSHSVIVFFGTPDVDSMKHRLKAFIITLKSCLFSRIWLLSNPYGYRLARGNCDFTFFVCSA